MTTSVALCCACMVAAGGGVDHLDTVMAAGLRFVFDRYFSETTSLVYSYPPEQVQKADFFQEDCFVWPTDIRIGDMSSVASALRTGAASVR